MYIGGSGGTSVPPTIYMKHLLFVLTDTIINVDRTPSSNINYKLLIKLRFFSLKKKIFQVNDSSWPGWSVILEITRAKSQTIVSPRLGRALP
jgi:hypothetical protein